MKYSQLAPVKKWHSNATLQGHGPNVPNLPVTKYVGNSGPVVTSTYQASFWERLRFLFSSGVVHISVLGETHAPIALGMGELFEKE